MIYGCLENLSDAANTLPENILKGLHFLEKTDLMALPTGRTDIDGDRLFAMVQDYDPKPAEDVKPEAHKRYIDIQYVVKGEELIGIAPLCKGAEMVEDLLEDKDVCFFDKPAQESMLFLSQGSYAVFYPWDIHRPGCRSAKPSHVRKVVVKIEIASS